MFQFSFCPYPLSFLTMPVSAVKSSQVRQLFSGAGSCIRAGSSVTPVYRATTSACCRAPDAELYRRNLQLILSSEVLLPAYQVLPWFLHPDTFLLKNPVCRLPDRTI